MSIYNANNLRVYVGGTLVANNTSCTVDINNEEVIQNSKDNPGWVNARLTRGRVSVSADHLFDEADAGISAAMTALLAKTPVTIIAGEDTPTAGEINFSGTFLPASGSFGGDTDADVTGGFTWNSTGEVTYNVGV